MIIRCIVVSALWIFLLPLQLSAAEVQNPLLDSYTLSLSQALAKAHAHSATLRAAWANVAAAQALAAATKSPLFPQVSIEGTVFYQTHVPEKSLGIGDPIVFGTHDNSSIGPVLSYTLFDGGQNRKMFQSKHLLYMAQLEQFKTAEKELNLKVQQAYFSTQWALKNVVLASEALKVSQAQYTDINRQFKAGSVNRLDNVSAYNETLNYQIRFLQAQQQLTATLRQLINLTGDPQPLHLSRPVPEQISTTLPDEIAVPSILITLDDITDTWGTLVNQLLPIIDSSSPIKESISQLQSVVLQAEAAQKAGDAYQSGDLPKIQASLKAQWHYPDGVNAEEAQNNIASVRMTFPLFNGGQNHSLATQAQRQSDAFNKQMNQLKSDLNTTFLTAIDNLENLKIQQQLHEKRIVQVEEAARLTYQTYRAGRINYLNVQEANLALLDAKIQSAKTQVQALNEMAVLRWLADESTGIKKEVFNDK